MCSWTTKVYGPAQAEAASKGRKPDGKQPEYRITSITSKKTTRLGPTLARQEAAVTRLILSYVKKHPRWHYAAESCVTGPKLFKSNEGSGMCSDRSAIEPALKSLTLE